MAESGVHACASAVRKAGKQSIQHAGVPVTREQIEDYVAHRQDEDRTSESIQKYARDLDALYRFLPEEKRIYPETLSQWRGSLLGEGYAPRTVNSMVSVANSFLKWLGHRELQLTGQLNIAYDQPELTRNEYLRLLSAARHLNKERTYLLVKVFTTVNITVLELPRLTVEAVRGDQVEFTANGVRYLAAIPSCLRDELLDYARRSCIASGPIFVTRTGKPLGRTAVTAYIQSLAQTARWRRKNVTRAVCTSCTSLPWTALRPQCVFWQSKAMSGFWNKNSCLWDGRKNPSNPGAEAGRRASSSVPQNRGDYHENLERCGRVRSLTAPCRAVSFGRDSQNCNRR